MYQQIRFYSIFGLFILCSFQMQANCIYGNCTNGKGTYLFRDGSKYTGSFLHSKPHGQGVFTAKDRSVYKGDFEQGLKSGKGQLKFQSGDTYTGTFVNDVMSGEGKMAYTNGDVYIGTWVSNRPSGKGRYAFRDGDVYTGGFLDGDFSGRGKLTRSDGSYYDGEWMKSKKHGMGISYTGGKKRTQKFDMNTLVTEGEFETQNSVVSTGASSNQNSQSVPKKDCTFQYCNNEKGYFTYGDGSVYEGDFINGEGQGQGICTYANGDKYIGGWKNHAPHGKGTMHFAQGNVYAAMWDNGIPTQKLLSEAPLADTKPKPRPSIAKDNGKTEIFALVVGVATYNHMQSLKYTDDDAYQLYAFLKSPEGGAISDDNVKVLIDDAATKQSITQQIQSLASRADENDVIMLYLSGHGLDGSFVPSDFDGFNNHLPYTEIIDMLNNSRAKHKLFMTDACHSGSMTVASRTPLNVALENFYSAYSNTNGGTAIMMSSKKEEVSLEYGGLRQGVFSHFLIKGLKGNADKNADKLITISELSDYVINNVKHYTANNQNPSIMGDYDPNMPIGMVR